MTPSTAATQVVVLFVVVLFLIMLYEVVVGDDRDAYGWYILQIYNLSVLLVVCEKGWFFVVMMLVVMMSPSRHFFCS